MTTRLRALLAALCLWFLFAPPAGAYVAVEEAGDPASATLKGLPTTGQTWNLSCEFAAASAATGYYGALITQQTFLNEIGYHPNPHKGFRGRISADWGGTTNYGIYAEPIEAALHDHDFAHSYTFYGNDGTGEATLRHEIASGHPVVTWVTGTFGPSTRYTATYEGETFSLIPLEHAVTIYGYDPAGVWLMDPSDPSKYHVGWQTFSFAWGQFDKMALVVAT